MTDSKRKLQKRRAAGSACSVDDFIGQIHNGDCIEGMNSLPEGSVDLVFADPPFNIGYDYDVYQDRLDSDDYLKWSREWIGAVYRALKADGTFWLAIGDEYAAELKVESQRLGFHCRSWVVWYYTFGVNCKMKFTRSHAHIFHFVKDRNKFTFRHEDPANRVPSARQLVYNDTRANSKGRLPDDTWRIPPANADQVLVDGPHGIGSESENTFTLRPQDLPDGFQPGENTWYFPRVAGTFKERAGFHGCQMPEQLLGRIIRTCSEEGEVVMDPFAGSASTLVVGKKLGRKVVGFELSPEYTAAGTERLEGTVVGSPLVGAAEPTMSAPPTQVAQKKRTLAPGETDSKATHSKATRAKGVGTKKKKTIAKEQPRAAAIKAAKGQIQLFADDDDS